MTHPPATRVTGQTAVGHSRRLVTIAILALAASVYACAAVTAADDIARRVKALEKSDWNSWLDEADKLSQDGRAKATAAARHLLEAVARAGDIESSNRALRLLAAIHRTKASPPDMPSAARILMELARRTGDRGLIAEIEEIRNWAIPEKKRLLSNAGALTARGNIDEAESCLRQALLLPFDIPAEVGPRIDDEAIRGMLLDLSAAVEGKYRSWLDKPARCAACAGRGSMTCERCGGKGKIRRTGPEPRPGNALYETCSRCSGLGIILCNSCKGSGCNFDALRSEQSSAFSIYMDAARKITMMKDVDDALAQAQSFLLACGLDLPPTFIPTDMEVRRLFPFRSTTNITNDLKDAWAKNAEKKYRIRLLADFGVNAVREMRPLRHMVGLSRTATPPRSLHEPWSDTAPVQISELSVFPAFWHDRFVSVRGDFQGKADLIGFDAGEFLKIGGERHDVSVVVWKTGLKSPARSISEIHQGFRAIGAFSQVYPFEDVNAALAALSPGTRIEIFGRFVFTADRSPRKLLEAFWIGAEGGAPPGAREGKAPSSPASFGPTPGPLLDAGEEWQLGRTRLDDLLASGMRHLRRASDLESRVMSTPASFAEKGEEYIASLQKARAFLEKAFERENSDALRSLNALVNSRILSAIETSRAR